MSVPTIESIQVIHLNATDFQKKMREAADAILIDVRTEEENHSARIPNSVLINMYQPGFMNQVNKLDKSKTYFVYCHSGGRSSVACELMVKNGFAKVYNLESGIISWHGELEQG